MPLTRNCIHGVEYRLCPLCWVRVATVVLATALLTWWVVLGDPCGRRNTLGLWSLRLIPQTVPECAYHGPLVTVRSPSGQLIDVWPGQPLHEGDHVAAVYDQSGKGLNIYQAAADRQPVLRRVDGIMALSSDGTASMGAP